MNCSAEHLGNWPNCRPNMFGRTYRNFGRTVGRTMMFGRPLFGSGAEITSIILGTECTPENIYAPECGAERAPEKTGAVQSLMSTYELALILPRIGLWKGRKVRIRIMTTVRQVFSG